MSPTAHDLVDQMLAADSAEQARRDTSKQVKANTPVAKWFGGADLLAQTFPARTPYLLRQNMPFLSAGDINQVYAVRGVGKTWYLMTLALMLANGKGIAGFHVPRKVKVVYVDGEMSRQEVQERFQNLSDKLNLQMHNDEIRIVAADWQPDYLRRIDTPEGQASIEELVDWAEVLIFDNRSCLFDSETEKDPAAWDPARDYLLSLRRRDKAVQLAHHSNRQGGARGLGKPEDIMNIVMRLSRPEEAKDERAQFICDVRQPHGKARGIHGPATYPFLLELLEDGWKCTSPNSEKAADDDLRISIIDVVKNAELAGQLVKGANAVRTLTGTNRKKTLAKFAEMVKDGELVAELNKKQKIVGYKIGVLRQAPDDIPF